MQLSLAQEIHYRITRALNVYFIIFMTVKKRNKEVIKYKSYNINMGDYITHKLNLEQ